ncbi:MAG: hypothetical protein GY704_07680, partial [Phycisphaeraceae bacterium]|nr:hypothetical protein [Phycisphaeraceae bacterium]
LAFVVCSNHHRVRARGRCRRYDDLAAGCLLDRPEAGRTVSDLFTLADRAAVPKGDRTVAVGRHGTLHQAVGRTGEKRLWLRFLTPGGHIRQAKPIRFDVPALVSAARAPIAASK